MFTQWCKVRKENIRGSFFLILIFSLFLSPAFSQDKNLTMASDTLAIAPSADAICPLKIGQKAPPLMLANIDGLKINLQQKISEKPAILVFYRGGWCPYCNRHLAELQDIESELIALGYQVIAVSPDKPEYLKASVEKEKLKYLLLSDSKMEAAAAFGIAYKVPNLNVTIHKARGSSLEKYSGEKHNLLPVPSVFILGKDGSIKFEYVNPDYKIRLSGAVLLAAAKAAIEEKE